MKSSLDLAITFFVLIGLITLLLTSELFAAPYQVSRGPLGFGFAELHEPMQTDRPYFTQRTETVQRGHLQGELGYRYTYDHEGSRTHAIPETLLRIGVLDIAEARFSLAGYEDRTAPGDSADGVGDLTIGTKVKIFEACDCNFSLSTLIELTVPTGSEELSQDEVSSKGALIWEYGWDDAWTIGGNFNADAAVYDGDYFFEPSSSLNLRFLATEQLTPFAEYVGFYPSGSHAPDTAPRHSLNFGLAIGLNRNLQLDIYSGLGLNETADDFFTGCGISFRV